jgi:hypothetical protein
VVLRGVGRHVDNVVDVAQRYAGVEEAGHAERKWLVCRGSGALASLG